MSTDVIADFEDSLLGSATAERTTADEFGAVLAEHVVEPAVGTPIPFEGVALPAGIAPPETPTELREANTGVTPAGLGVASYGSLTVRSRGAGDELVALYPERHVVVVAASDVVPDSAAAFDRLDREFAAGDRTQVFETGPSSTADMGSLIEGVHGPTEVHVLVLEDR